MEMRDKRPRESRVGGGAGVGVAVAVIRAYTVDCYGASRTPGETRGNLRRLCSPRRDARAFVVCHIIRHDGGHKFVIGGG